MIRAGYENVLSKLNRTRNVLAATILQQPRDLLEQACHLVCSGLSLELGAHHENCRQSSYDQGQEEDDDTLST